jgi:hypothetical protein
MVIAMRNCEPVRVAFGARRTPALLPAAGSAVSLAALLSYGAAEPVYH